MSDRDMAAMLQELTSVNVNDYAGMLLDLQSQPSQASVESGDEQGLASEILAVYEQTMDVYGPAEAVYESTIQVMNSVETGGVATTTNR